MKFIAFNKQVSLLGSLKFNLFHFKLLQANNDLQKDFYQNNYIDL